jgi:hypothetical protein
MRLMQAEANLIDRDGSIGAGKIACAFLRWRYLYASEVNKFVTSTVA